MTYLLDTSVLIALIDPAHVQHEIAHEWFNKTGSESWATCPITENGILRIVSGSTYSNSPGSPAAVARIFLTLRSQPGHRFWADDLSLLDHSAIDCSRLLTSGQVTDTYLLALAELHKGQLATFDRRMVTDAVAHSHPLICLLDSAERFHQDGRAV